MKNAIGGLPEYRHVDVNGRLAIYKNSSIDSTGWTLEWNDIARFYQQKHDECWGFSYWKRNDFIGGETRLNVYKGPSSSSDYRDYVGICLTADSSDTIDMLPAVSGRTFIMAHGYGDVYEFNMEMKKDGMLLPSLVYDRRKTILSNIHSGPPMVFIREIVSNGYFGVFTFYNGLKCHVAIYQHGNPRVLWEYHLNIPLTDDNIISRLYQNLIITPSGLAYLVVCRKGCHHLYELKLF